MGKSDFSPADVSNVVETLRPSIAKRRRLLLLSSPCRIHVEKRISHFIGKRCTKYAFLLLQHCGRARGWCNDAKKRLWGERTQNSICTDQITQGSIVLDHCVCFFFESLCLICKCSFPDPPEVSIELGSKLNAVDIREGDDVYFECTIDAFPSAERIFWKKDVSNSNQFIGAGITITTVAFTVKPWWIAKSTPLLAYQDLPFQQDRPGLVFFSNGLCFEK